MALAQIRFADTIARLTSVEVSDTYGGLIEGYPNARVNDRHLDSMRRRMQEKYGHLPQHVFEPVRVSDPDRLAARHGMGEWEELPPVECLGMLVSVPLDLDAGPYTRSCLAVAWWQENDGRLVGEGVRAAFGELRWYQLAEDRED